MWGVRATALPRCRERGDPGPPHQSSGSSRDLQPEVDFGTLHCTVGIWALESCSKRWGTIHSRVEMWVEWPMCGRQGQGAKARATGPGH